MNIAVFASGNGTNFQAILEAVKKRNIPVKLSLLVCDNPKAFVIKRALKAKIKVALIKRGDFSDKRSFERAIIQQLKENKIKLVVLAGFMRMLGVDLLSAYKNKIINIHPALLPAFKGSTAIKDAFDYGAKVTGVTVHFVDALMDHGPIILQQAIEIKRRDTFKSLEETIHKIEHRIYPEAIKLIVEGRLKVSGRKVKVVNP